MEEQNQISYEELAREYNVVVEQNRQLQLTLQQMQFDKVNDQLKTMISILADKDKFSKNIVKLAEWNVKKILSKPKKAK